MRSLVLAFWGLIYSVTCFSQQNNNYSFVLENQKVDSFLQVVADFTIYGHQSVLDGNKLVNNGKLKFYINNNSYPDYKLFYIETTDSIKVRVIYDQFEKKDSIRLLKIIPEILHPANTSYIEESNNNVVVLYDSVRFASSLLISHLTKNDTFALRANTSKLLDFLIQTKSFSPNTVLLFVSNNFNEEKLQSINSLVAPNCSGNKPLIALLNLGNIPLYAQDVKKRIDNIPFVINNASLDDENALFNMAPLIDAWKQKYFRLQFSLSHIPDSLLLEIPHFKYKLEFLGREDEPLQYQLPLSISNDAVFRFYVRIKTEKIDSLILNSEFEKAMSVILKTNKEHSFDALNELAERNILAYGNGLADNNEEESYQKFKLFEKKWENEFSAGYIKERLKICKRYYANLPTKELNVNNERLILSTEIYSQEVNCVNELNVHLDSAYVVMEYKNDDWLALSLFKKASEINSNCKTNAKQIPTIKNEIDSIGRVLLLKAIRTDYSKKYYKRIVSNALKFDNWYMKQFKFEEMFKIAESYRLCSYYKDAMAQYENLISNWEDQSFLDWDGAFYILQEMYLKNAKFEDALEMNQRIYRAESIEQEKKNMALEMTLVTVRAKYLKPVVDIFSEVAKGRSGAEIKTKFNFNAVQLPSWLTGVSTLDADRKPIFTFYATDTFRLNPKSIGAVGGRTTIVLEKQNNIYWLIKKLENVGKEKFIAFQISNKNRTIKEKTILDEISRSKMDERLWLNLFSEVEKEGAKYGSQFIAALLETSILEKEATGNSKKIEAWISHLKEQNDCIGYFAFHPSNEDAIKKSANLPGIYKTGEFERSSRAVAYYEQIVESDTNKYYDVCNPIYVGSTYLGVLRLGYITYYQ